MRDPRILVVVLEYHREQERVITRGVWPRGEVPQISPLHEGNNLQHVQCFEGDDNGLSGVGFTNLVPAP